jgi:dihydroflavonol-4-reductase
LEGLDVELVPGDVLDCDSLRNAASGISTLYHLAGVISIQPGLNLRVRKVNVEGTCNVLEAARAEGVRRMVYTSSIHALQRIPHGQVIDESTPYDPEHAISAYDCSKAEASLAVKARADAGFNAVIVCPTGVIGPYDYRRSEMGQLICDMMKHRIVPMVAGAYDFVDVRDVADGLIQAARHGRSGETYILSGTQVGMIALLEMVRMVAGTRTYGLRVPGRLAQIAAPLFVWAARIARRRPLITPYSLATVFSNSVVSFRKAAQELGYQPRALQETIEDTVRWWRERQVLA